MAVEITLPKLGLTMEEGTVEVWLVADGDVISVGTPLLRLATDKIDVDVEAEAEGILARAGPDGYTLLGGGDSVELNRYLMAAPPYDADRDLLAIQQLASMLQVHTQRSHSPTTAEFRYCGVFLL